MAKLVWDDIGEKIYRTGVDHGVLYVAEGPSYGKGVAWNGLTNVNESPSGGEANDSWADNLKYASIISAESFGGTIEAFTYPPEFAPCDGQVTIAKGVTANLQGRKRFAFCYRTLLGNDTMGQDYGYELHIIYGCSAAPSEKSNATINDSPEPQTMSWTISTTPVPVPGHKPTAMLTFDSTKTDATKLAALEDILYGGADTEARLPLPAEIITLMSEDGNG